MPKIEDRFQHIGPNDPLVFSKKGQNNTPPLPPPQVAPPPPEQIEPTPMDGAMVIPKDQEEKYKALQAMAAKHMARQRGNTFIN